MILAAGTVDCCYPIMLSYKCFQVIGKSILVWTGSAFGVAHDAIPNEYLTVIAVPEMLFHETVLKFNCPIILLRNLYRYEGPFNRTWVIVTGIAE